MPDITIAILTDYTHLCMNPREKEDLKRLFRQDADDLQREVDSLIDEVPSNDEELLEKVSSHVRLLKDMRDSMTSLVGSYRDVVKMLKMRPALRRMRREELVCEAEDERWEHMRTFLALDSGKGSAESASEIWTHLPREFKNPLALENVRNCCLGTPDSARWLELIDCLAAIAASKGVQG